MPLEFVKSERGRDHLVHDGYRYIMHRKGDAKNVWYCVKQREEKCCGRLYTANNEVLQVNDNHNHAPDIAKIHALEIKSKIKVAAQTTSEHPQVILASCTEGIGGSVSAQLPLIRTLKRTIRRDRVRVNNSHPIPTSLLTLHIPHKYTRTATDENFLLFDSGPSTDRILIFGTSGSIRHMESSPQWFADGTFKVAPQLFDQVIK